MGIAGTTLFAVFASVCSAATVTVTGELQVSSATHSETAAPSADGPAPVSKAVLIGVGAGSAFCVMLLGGVLLLLYYRRNLQRSGSSRDSYIKPKRVEAARRRNWRRGEQPPPRSMVLEEEEARRRSSDPDIQEFVAYNHGASREDVDVENYPLPIGPPTSVSHSTSRFAPSQSDVHSPPPRRTSEPQRQSSQPSQQTRVHAEELLSRLYSELPLPPTSSVRADTETQAVPPHAGSSNSPDPNYLRAGHHGRSLADVVSDSQPSPGRSMTEEVQSGRGASQWVQLPEPTPSEVPSSPGRLPYLFAGYSSHDPPLPARGSEQGAMSGPVLVSRSRQAGRAALPPGSRQLVLHNAA